jgi:hypothetical protein
MSDKTEQLNGTPVQAWAHREGLVHLRPLEAGAWAPDAVQARLQIAETFNRFAIGHDEFRIDVVLSCFAQDATFCVAEGHAEPFATHRGRPAIGAALTSSIGQQGDQRRHLIANITVEHLDATTASVLAYGLVSAVASSSGSAPASCTSPTWFSKPTGAGGSPGSSSGWISMPVPSPPGNQRWVISAG